ncbi:NifB/NifX family molybdenum-iron cluster-binding protein [bacterium]|nr:NifB/NifX family molybdenum-iron cluster-binding protein [bacterium]
MKIAVSSQGKTMDALFETRFGRADYFIVMDTETGDVRPMDNQQQLEAMQGAGIQAARHVAKAGAQVLVTGHVGPKAFAALHAAGIKIYTLEGQWTIAQVMEKYQSDQLKSIAEADVEGHWV